MVANIQTINSVAKGKKKNNWSHEFPDMGAPAP